MNDKFKFSVENPPGRQLTYSSTLQIMLGYSPVPGHLSYDIFERCSRIVSLSAGVANGTFRPHINAIARPARALARLRDFVLPLPGTTRMDINYILGREQISLYNASVAKSAPARIAHEGLAREYGRLLAGSAFPHRDPLQVRFGPTPADSADRWDDDGGTVALK